MKCNTSQELCKKTHGVIYFPRKRIPRKPTVIRRLGVRRKSFAGNLISRMYDYYFAGAIDFQKEYRKYYRKEFSSLAEFIEEHYNIEKGMACELTKGSYAKKDCSAMSIERNIETLNYDHEFKKLFSEAVGGIIDEDPDGIYY